jgi:hypothetical protein
MRLTIQPLNAPMQSVNIAQTQAARSASSPIGTRNLMNCLGVVLHNRLGNVGVIAHVEAQSNAAQYDQVANAAIAKMLADLNAHGGSTGSLSLALLGNAGAHKVVINRNPFGFRLAPPDFTDRRGQEGAFILDPVKETLYVDMFGAHVADAPSNRGVTVYAIQ